MPSVEKCIYFSNRNYDLEIAGVFVISYRNAAEENDTDYLLFSYSNNMLKTLKIIDHHTLDGVIVEEIYPIHQLHAARIVYDKLKNAISKLNLNNVSQLVHRRRRFVVQRPKQRSIFYLN